jgi:hypothetical protein
MIRIQRITEGIDDEIDRLAKGPTQTDWMRFESILARQYEATKMAVHVITGSLKSSGKMSSDTDGNKWEGVISYGGLSMGIHNPVEYAEYELEREGSHNFLEPAVRMSRQYINAINAFLEG